MFDSISKIGGGCSSNSICPTQSFSGASASPCQSSQVAARGDSACMSQEASEGSSGCGDRNISALTNMLGGLGSACGASGASGVGGAGNVDWEQKLQQGLQAVQSGGSGSGNSGGSSVGNGAAGAESQQAGGTTMPIIGGANPFTMANASSESISNAASMANQFSANSPSVSSVLSNGHISLPGIGSSALATSFLGMPTSDGGSYGVNSAGGPGAAKNQLKADYELCMQSGGQSQVSPETLQKVEQVLGIEQSQQTQQA